MTNQLKRCELCYKIRLTWNYLIKVGDFRHCTVFYFTPYNYMKLVKEGTIPLE